MTDDERAIRQVIETWMQASRDGDTATVLSLMTEDAVFMVPGREPFGKEADGRWRLARDANLLTVKS